MRGIIKMSVTHGSNSNGNWGLVRQIGPWKPTSRDKVGAGYTQGNVDIIRPYIVRGDKPPPKLSHWAQRSIVSKKAYTPGIQRIGMKTDSVGSILKGIHSTLLGIGARGSGTGVGQGKDQVDNNGIGNKGNDNGEGNADNRVPELISSSGGSSDGSSDDYAEPSPEIVGGDTVVGGSIVSKGVTNIVGQIAQGVGSRATGSFMGYVAEQGSTSLNNAFGSREAMAEGVLRSVGLDSYVPTLHGFSDNVHRFWTLIERNARDNGIKIAGSAATMAMNGDVAQGMFQFAEGLSVGVLTEIMNQVVSTVARATTPTPERRQLVVNTGDSEPLRITTGGSTSSEGSTTPTETSPISPNQDNVDRINEINGELEGLVKNSKPYKELVKERTALKAKTTRNRKSRGIEDTKRGYT